MEPTEAVGDALAALRHLRGQSLEACAHDAGLTVCQVEAVERGGGDAGDASALAALYGLRSDDLNPKAVTLDGASGATVFLLHSEAQSFDMADIVCVAQAMRAARLYAAFSTQAQEPLRRRRRFTAVPAAGPRNADAARQGYVLARRVRASLAQPTAPMGDLRALLEDHFGIPVLVQRLASYDLRAAAALDADRGCAAVLLSADDESRRNNPWLARVYLAHELCHVLFDPSAPGQVQIALDAQIEGPARGPYALREARAKGFAAEFLLPEAGLRALFAGEAPPDTPEAAGVRVRRAAEHFQTSWQIALYHLGNLGMIPSGLEALRPPGERVTGQDSTTLPDPGALPKCLGGIVEAARVWEGVGHREAEVPAFVAGAREAGAAALDAVLDETLERVRAEADAGRVAEASDQLVAYVDDRLLGGEIAHARAVFDRLDVATLNPRVSTTLGALTWHHREALGAARAQWVESLLAALPGVWAYEPARVDKLARRLR